MHPKATYLTGKPLIFAETIPNFSQPVMPQRKNAKKVPKTVDIQLKVQSNKCVATLYDARTPVVSTVKGNTAQLQLGQESVKKRASQRVCTSKSISVLMAVRMHLDTDVYIGMSLS